MRASLSNSLARSALLALIVGWLLPGCDRSPPGDADLVLGIFGETGLGNGQFSYPRAIAVSPTDGHVFVCDKTARIQRFDTEGCFETSWRMPEWEHGKPTGMSFDAQGRLWVADTHYQRVIVYDREGREQFRFGGRGEGPGQFIFPTCVCWDAGGNIYVGEYGGNDRISKFSPKREFLMAFGRREDGPASLERPTQIKWDPRGFLWVADGCNHRICRFSTDGKLLGQFGHPGSGPGELNYPYDLELVSGSPVRLIVTDHGNNRVVEFSEDGRLLRSWGSQGREKGQLLQPWGAALGGDGRLYVLDSWSNRVQIVRW